MDRFPDIYTQLKFRHSWRPYQQRVLDAVDRHLRDSRLHVVAAPGSGKTTLGLEIFRKLGKPAVALSPTRTIRDQWVDRLRDFMQENPHWPPSWTSVDLAKPAPFMSVTYQALHGIYRDGEVVQKDDAAETDAESGELEQLADDAPTRGEIDALAALLTQAGIGTLILDEAHHLRAEWWKALSALAERLPNVTIVSLTATPPYDVVGTEWTRYEELCGPIDEEISVPELVKSGTLCPHQDFLWTVVPLKRERDLVRQYDVAVDRFGQGLLHDPLFEQAVATHPWVAAPTLDQDAVLDSPEAAIALIVFLRAKSLPLPERLAALLDVEITDIPAWSTRWCQALLKDYLFSTSWSLSEPLQSHRKQLASALRAEHLLERRSLCLEKSRLVKSRLTLSAAKIGACVQIHLVERRFRGESLRQVVLTDFIREISAPAAGLDAPLPLGAWPVFKAIIDALGPESASDIALLTGRLVVVSETVLASLRMSLPNASAAEPVPGMPGFMQLHDVGSSAVRGVTALLHEGILRTIVGTRALLGEGWDAPSVNSLVLASFVGSYMLTNQMRGRAIRVDRRQPKKIASIWHIVAVAPELASGGLDIGELTERFRTFVGLSEREAAIESGLYRLSTPLIDSAGNPILGPNWRYNGYMVRRLFRIDRVAERWRQAIEVGEAGHVSPTVKMREPFSVAPIWFNKTLRYLLIQIGALFGAAFSAVANLFGHGSSEKFLVALLIASIVASIIVLPKLVKAAVLWLRHRPVDGTVRQIALAVRDSLCQTDQLLGAPSSFPVETAKHQDGSVTISLARGTLYERALYADCVNEILGPVANPRYLLTRGLDTRFGRVDYHAVPMALGEKKEFAEVLCEAWVRRIGPTELIYVRGQDGRQTLLKARTRAFSNAIQKRTERFDRWQ